MSFSLNPFTGKLDKIKKAVWGTITGTLSDQTDLQAALDAKADDADVVHTTGTETIAGAKTFTGNANDVPVTITNIGTGDSFVVNDESGDASPFVINANGNIGIGTTTPANKLEIQSAGNVFARLYSTNASGYASQIFKGTGREYRLGVGGASEVTIGVANKFYIYDASAPAVRAVIDTSGNVGIGTTSPQAKLEVSGSGTGSAVKFYLDGDRGVLNAQSGVIAFRNKSTNIASIDGYTGAAGGSISYGQLVFSTANNASLIERMRVDENGNVGIGTTNPGSLLHLASSNPVIRVEDTDGGYSTWGGNGGHLTFSADVGNTVGGTRIAFETDGTEKVRIDSTGNVGIGLTPTARLHIKAGTASANTAPIKLTAGTLNTTPETGAIEYDGTAATFVRSGTTREVIYTGNSAATAPATNTIGVVVDYYGTSATRVLTTPNTWLSVTDASGNTYKIPAYS